MNVFLFSEDEICRNAVSPIPKLMLLLKLLMLLLLLLEVQTTDLEVRSHHLRIPWSADRCCSYHLLSACVPGAKGRLAECRRQGSIPDCRSAPLLWQRCHRRRQAGGGGGGGGLDLVGDLGQGSGMIGLVEHRRPPRPRRLRGKFWPRAHVKCV